MNDKDFAILYACILGGGGNISACVALCAELWYMQIQIKLHLYFVLYIPYLIEKQSIK